MAELLGDLDGAASGQSHFPSPRAKHHVLRLMRALDRISSEKLRRDLLAYAEELAKHCEAGKAATPPPPRPKPPARRG